MATNSSDDQSRPSSKEDKLNTAPKLLLRRNKQRSTRKKRSTSPKLTKDEIKYQRFVQDLKRDIQVQMKQYMQEERFNTRDKTDPSVQLLRAAIRSKQGSSTIISHRTNDVETVTTALSQRQDPLSFLKQNAQKRLEADVRKIITGPALKQFYTQFIRPSAPIYQPETPIPFEESIVHVPEQ